MASLVAARAKARVKGAMRALRALPLAAVHLAMADAWEDLGDTNGLVDALEVSTRLVTMSSFFFSYFFFLT